MRVLRIPNPILESGFRTRLGSDYSASDTTLTVENNASFAANDFLVVGTPSEETAEMKKITGTSGNTTLSLSSALNFTHQKGVVVYKTPWDFVSIERRTSSSGTMAEISQSGIQWDNPNNETVYYDANATDAYEYRFRFYNSSSGIYSEYSPTITGAGFDRDQVGYMIRTVRKLTNDLQSKIVTNDEIIWFFNEYQDIIYSHNPKYWFLLVDTYKGSNGIAATAGNNVYTLSGYSTFGHIDTVRYKLVTGGANELYHLSKKGSVEFDKIASDLNTASDDWAWIYKLLPEDSSSDNGYLQIFPVTKTTGVGTLYPNYYEKMADLESVADATQVPLPKLLEQYAIGKIEQIKGNAAKADVLLRFLVPQSENDIPAALVMLDQMDFQQKSAQGQPRSIWNFRGQKAVHTFFGRNRGIANRDYIRENYAD